MSARAHSGLTVFLAGLLAFGCGYRFVSAAGRLPDGGQRIAIDMAASRSTEPWAGPHLTAALRLEADRAGLLLAGEGERARLRARVERIDALPRAVALQAGRFQTREQEIEVEVSLELILADGRRRDFVLRERQSVLSAPDIRMTLANREMAARLALERIARTAMRRMTRRFDPP
ncbi:MAG: hypothetical protein JXR96_06245 [Deltaproteobacteria bacterium]|nr:hypothetical protein [Deltaproteobacteria bacterium]